jgi:ABC-type Fe3+/spermidine/putrescine transport system ATPase subunit
MTRSDTQSAVESAGVHPGGARQMPGSDYLKLADITKSYGSVAVVKNTSLSVRKGEILTILGPSGCGKTTTLKIIAGFIEPDSGSVLMEGSPVDRLTSHQRGAAMVFQNYALFPHLTATQNIAFGLRMRRMAKPDVTREVDAMLDRVRLTPFRDRYPKELSGGQQQRVALARALIIKPKVLLLDEPFSSLDAKLRKQLREEFLEIHRNFNITSIFVTHDLEEAFALSDKVAVMNAGVIEQFGAPSEIFSRPRSRFVADFVGHKNFIEGVVTESSPEGATMAAAGLAMKVAAMPKGPALASILVHRLRIARGRPDAPNCFEATVTHVSFLGPIMQISVKIGDLALETQQPSSAEIESVRTGDRVYAAWNREDVVAIPAGRTAP